ncbi:MAG: toxin-antitoxin system TumE family protein [Steroidobacteraceae bacterium]
MRARLLVDQRIILSDHEFAELVIWALAAPLRGSAHELKYRLAFVVDGECVLRYDNEAGKGDHRHIGGQERTYRFESIDKLLADFERDIARWRDENHNS